MPCMTRIAEWTEIVAAQLPHLSRPQVTVLALGSLGMVRARSCALTAVSTMMASVVGRTDDAVRQQ